MSEEDESFESFSSKPKLKEDEFYYSDEGFIVFTEVYHLRRGYCCKSGCKHCPYGFDKKTGRVLGKKK